MTNKNEKSAVLPNCVINSEIKPLYTKENEIDFCGKRVAIIDDDDGVRLFWRRKIKEKGGSVLWEAISGSEIINNKYDYSKIDLAIVDYSYPDTEINGIDVIKHLKINGIKEIYLCTGHYDNDEIYKEAISAGANFVIPKG